MSADPHGAPGAPWSPAQYQRFKGHRARPAAELLARVPLEAPARIVDLGCGGGEATALLRARYPGAKLTGIDSSPAMLESARASGIDAEWRLGDIGDLSLSGAPQLLFSNAALHWLPDHDALLPRLMAALAPGGVLAVQMPLSWPLASHRLIRALLSVGGQGGKALGTDALQAELDRRPVAEARDYYAWLRPHCAQIDVWETEYLQVLEGNNPIFEWVKATGLRPVLGGLEGDERARFLAHYQAELPHLYPPEPGGETLYPFRRLFIVATKGA